MKNNFLSGYQMDKENIKTHYSIYPISIRRFKIHLKKYDYSIDDFIIIDTKKRSIHNGESLYKFYYKNYVSNKNEIPNIEYETQYKKYKFYLKDYGFISDCPTKYKENGKWKKYKYYEIWRTMIRRCYDVNKKDYKHYGGKGIYVSD